MKTQLEQNQIDIIIRELYKIDSKLRACPVLAAFRENRRLIAFLEKSKIDSKTQIKKKEEDV